MSDWSLEASPNPEFGDRALTCRIGIEIIEGLPRWFSEFHLRGPARQTDFSQPSHYAFLAQFPHICLRHPEAAKALGVVLAELGGDIAHPHTLADPDRGP